jgi:hypothetical protein
MSIAGTSSNITKSSNTIDLYQGESRDIDLEVVEEVDDVNGVPTEQPVDLTGATVYFSVRTKPNSPDLLIGKNSTNALEIEIPAPRTNGIAIIHLLSGDTKNMFPGEYVFDAWVVLSSGKSVPVIEIAEFIVKEPVTKLP